jgi:hypothetical protein
MSSPEGLIWREMQQQTLSGDKKSPEKLFLTQIATDGSYRRHPTKGSPLSPQHLSQKTLDVFLRRVIFLTRAKTTSFYLRKYGYSQVA